METTENKSKLEYLITYEVQQFKDLKGIKDIDIKQGPNSMFLAWAGPVPNTAAIAKEGIPAKEVQRISLVRSPDTGKEFYLLHKKGGESKTIGTL